MDTEEFTVTMRSVVALLVTLGVMLTAIAVLSKITEVDRPDLRPALVAFEHELTSTGPTDVCSIYAEAPHTVLLGVTAAAAQIGTPIDRESFRDLMVLRCGR